ncbi:LOW QUALITY PROTEIN: uncharacterized protein LOC143500444 [Brachyhypopomus gauderio]|uniref:LOW QUALITY PROTEIN: uncharacterized protein LOC143500444 n=1 Tax=Brachyhypopomus gauderio TaxID=698409 RepID=UPI004042B380
MSAAKMVKHGGTKESADTKSARSARAAVRGLKRGHHWSVLFLFSVALQSQVVHAGGSFELQIHEWQNSLGILQSGQCCDLQPSGGQRCSSADQCDTFFRVCLKEYQARVAPTGTCTFGIGSTPVLGGNSHTIYYHGHEGAEGGRIIIPFKYAWPKSFSLVIEVLDHDNETSQPGQEELIERVLLSSMLNPGEQWQTYRHHGRPLSLEYRLRFRCHSNYYGPQCNEFCRSRDDFFGHFDCDATGSKVCKDGWEGQECRQAICKQGCNLAHGTCSLPGECKCHYGWKGDLCDECETYPGCDHGTCTEPWKCVCDTNWGGLLCDKDLNYCGNHQPCKNGGTCINTEPNEYQCVCQDGFLGRNCDIVEHACLSSPCVNGATCVENQTSFSCVCADGWTGLTCSDAILHCDSQPCGRGSTCTETPHGFQCLCPPGWSGRSCQIDMNECETGICVHARSCRNLIGGYLCDCLPGWEGPNCDRRNSSCQGPCFNGGRCEDSLCICLPGFSGERCQTGVGACDSAPCLHGGKCMEQKGVLFCNCPQGYTGTYCEEVADLCNPNPCQKGVPCQSTEVGYMCACPEGYFGNECMSLKELCHGTHCQVSGPGGGEFILYMVLLGVLAVLVACGFSACALLLSRQHRRRQRRTKQPAATINNQRHVHAFVRNVEQGSDPPVAGRAVPALWPEEIELTLPPSPALKPAHVAKLDICNREREKLNRFQYGTDGQEMEA